MKANRILELSTLTLVLCLAVSASTRRQGNSITGKVSNSAGKNLSQIMVELETGNGQPANTTITNNEGDFYFSGLTSTSYIIVIRQIDYEPVSEHVDFVRTVGAEDPGERRAVQITLVPKGASVAIPSNRVVSYQTLPKGAREALDRAMKLAKENKSSEVVAALNEAIKAYPDYFEAHMLLGGEYLKMERFNDAIAEFEQSRRINPKDDRVYRGFGQVLMMQKKYALASQVLGEAARLNPTDPGIPLMRATALIEHAAAINPTTSKEAAAERKTAFELAEKDLAKALELSGKKLTAVHLQLARLYEKKGDRARAADELEQYLRMAPDDKKADAIRAAIKTLRSPAVEKKPMPPKQ
ncbi:MAG: tetratricopeptide repeat protein [Acidobacteriota bacterium]